MPNGKRKRVTWGRVGRMISGFRPISATRRTLGVMVRKPAKFYAKKQQVLRKSKVTNVVRKPATRRVARRR